MSTPKRKRARPAAAPESTTERQAADLAAFRRMMQVSNGTFSLSFAVCQDHSLRKTLIQRLCEEFPGTLVVTLPEKVDDVLSYVQSQLAPATTEAIFILGLESSIPFEGELQPAIRVLNSSRESWERLHCPVVFWLAEYALAKLARHAPDFWRYRSHQFEFIPDEHYLDVTMEDSFPGHDVVDGLPYEEKLFRLSELETRLREAGTPPSPELLPHVVAWAYELANLYRHSNRFDEAEFLLRQILDWQKSAHGKGSPLVASALNNLATLLIETNRMSEAETLMRQALEIAEISYGLDHPIVSNQLNNLAQIFRHTNRLSEAEPLMRRALAIDETSYGPSHPNVALRLSNLATLLQATSRLDEAESLMRRALEIGEASGGPTHPTVAIRLNNLALLLNSTNRLSEAEPLMRRALQIDEASYGPSHPMVAARLNNLGAMLKATNRLAEAESLMRRALEITEASYGPCHPKVATYLSNLAVLLMESNRLLEAEPQMLRALEIDEANYGPFHPDVAIRLNNLAQLLQATNRLHEAEPLMWRMVEIFITFTIATGHPHPHLQTAIQNYGGLLMEMGQTQEQAKAKIEELLAPLRKTEGGQT